MGVERCVRYAFELARSRPRKHLTLVHKTNVLTFAGDLWQRTFDAVAAEYPDVATAYHHVDAACIYFVQDPGRYDVIVTDNLFGDILTDLGGAVAGGIGRAASANLNPARTGPSLFEPVHGSAPDIAGTGQADPRAAIISAAMMLEFLGEADAAARVRTAVDKSDDVDRLAPPRSATRSLGGSVMPFEKTEKIWMDGELVPWDEASVHVLTHSLHYGSGVFEGIRTYATADGPAVFRLTDHIERLLDSAKLIMMDDPVHARRARRGVQAHRARERARLLLHPADRVPRLRRDRAQPAAVRGRTCRSRCGRGARTSARRASKPACG